MKYFIPLFLLMIFSCSSNHEININKDNSATINFTVTNKESLVETLKEWGAIENRDSIISTDDLQKGLSSNRNIKEVVVLNPQPNRYSGSFKVTDILKLFNDSKNTIPEEEQIFSITEDNGSKTLGIKLSIDNYRYLKQTVPLLQEESIDMLGPDANQDVSKEDYLDMMSFSLGDKGPEDILSSSINLKINVEGSITAIDGGEIISDNSALFSIPLIDLILLQKTLTYSVTYK